MGIKRSAASGNAEEHVQPGQDSSALRTMQRAVAIIAQRVRDARLHQLLGESVGYELGGPYHGTLARIGRVGQCSITELANNLGLETSTVSRRVRALEDRGFVEREVDRTDRRSVRVRLTPLGAEVFNALDQGWLDYLGLVVLQWDETRVERFARDLGEFADILEAGAAQSGAAPRAIVCDAHPKAAP